MSGADRYVPRCTRSPPIWATDSAFARRARDRARLRLRRRIHRDGAGRPPTDAGGDLHACSAALLSAFFSELTELPFAFLLAAAFLAYVRRWFFLMAILIGLSPLGRPEGFGFLILGCDRTDRASKFQWSDSASGALAAVGLRGLDAIWSPALSGPSRTTARSVAMAHVAAEQLAVCGTRACTCPAPVSFRDVVADGDFAVDFSGAVGWECGGHISIWIG